VRLQALGDEPSAVELGGLRRGIGLGRHATASYADPRARGAAGGPLMLGGA
jgi:hypothetical protein